MGPDLGWWAVKDLHLRSPKATDLQSALVDYLSNCPETEESVRFELTDGFPPSVFKTDTINLARSTLQNYSIVTESNYLSRSDTDRTCVIFIPNEVPETTRLRSDIVSAIK